MFPGSSDPTARYFIPALTKKTIRTSSEKIMLLLDQSNGEVYVKELEVGSEGIAYLFSEPKLQKVAIALARSLSTE